MKAQTFSYVAAIIFMLATQTAIGQDGKQKNQRPVQTQDFPTVDQYKGYSREQQQQELKRIIEYNKKNKEYTEIEGTLGEQRDGVVFNKKEGEYEAELDNVIRQSDGSELGIVHDVSNAGANAKTSERKYSYSRDAFQGNDGDNQNSNEKAIEEKNDNQTSVNQKEQIKSLLNNYINAVSAYNSALDKWNKANAKVKTANNYKERESLQTEANNKIPQVTNASNTARGYGNSIMNNNNASQKLKNVVSKVNREMEVPNNPVNDLNVLRGFFENDCNTCFSE